jgi:predicted nucleic acid-binding protein
VNVFIDTSAFCAFTIPRDQHNSAAKALYKTIQKDKVALYTSDYVLDEVYTLLKTRGSHATSVKFMDEIIRSNITLLRVTEDIERAAKIIFRRFDDKRLSYTDCTSFALINQFGIDAVFAFDEHFRYHPYKHSIKFFG